MIPDDVALPPIWVLASSGATAAFAGAMGLGYGFARHFSPSPPGPAIAAYRSSFRPSVQFPQPHVILGVAVVCAPTQEEATYLASSSDLAWVKRHRGELGPLPTPEEASRYPYTPQDQAVVAANRERQFVGTADSVVRTIRQLVDETAADEVMVTTMVYGRAERLAVVRIARGGMGKVTGLVGAGFPLNHGLSSSLRPGAGRSESPPGRLRDFPGVFNRQAF